MARIRNEALSFTQEQLAIAEQVVRQFIERYNRAHPDFPLSWDDKGKYHLRNHPELKDALERYTGERDIGFVGGGIIYNFICERPDEADRIARGESDMFGREIALGGNPNLVVSQRPSEFPGTAPRTISDEMVWAFFPGGEYEKDAAINEGDIRKRCVELLRGNNIYQPTEEQWSVYYEHARGMLIHDQLSKMPPKKFSKFFPDGPVSIAQEPQMPPTLPGGTLPAPVRTVQPTKVFVEAGMPWQKKTPRPGRSPSSQTPVIPGSSTLVGSSDTTPQGNVAAPSTTPAQMVTRVQQGGRSPLGQLKHRVENADIVASTQTQMDNVYPFDPAALFYRIMTGWEIVAAVYGYDIITNGMGLEAVYQILVPNRVYDLTYYCGITFISVVLAFSHQISNLAGVTADRIENHINSVNQDGDLSSRYAILKVQEKSVGVLRSAEMFFKALWYVDFATSALPFINRFGLVLGGMIGGTLSYMAEIVEEGAHANVLSKLLLQVRRNRS